MRKIRRALISVYDKRDVVDFCTGLAALGVELLSTGGTARLLREAGLAPVEVSDYTGFPELMGGRVKTLHPRIHAALLGRPGQDEAVMREHEILPIDLLAVNLYPFEQVVRDADCELERALEHIDIGGPAMLRAAAKNHAAVAAVVDSADYPSLLQELRANAGALGRATRFRLACKAFAHTAAYDGNISNYLGALDMQGQRGADFPSVYTMQFQRGDALRYGENPHQRAAFYRQFPAPQGSLAAATKLQGKALSYNNFADSDTALECALQFAEPACVIVKHLNPCGVAIADTLLSAYERAYATDPVSAYGGIIACNRELDESTASAILERQFAEVIIAPAVSSAARTVLAGKPALRVLAAGVRCASGSPCAPEPQLVMRRVSGGLLLQDADEQLLCAGEPRCVSSSSPTEAQMADLLFAWRVAKFVRSNAIVYCREGRTIGVGAGQMSRVYSARIAALKAEESGLEVAGSVMASDAFFPFRDSIDQAAELGISAVIQPGGSRRDEEVIRAAEEHGMVMLFTGTRHFLH